MTKVNKIKSHIINYWPQLLFILVVIIGYWQIIFFQTTFKFDAIYNHLPWRFLIVDNLRHGHLPLWNYYHHLGTPIHADPQSGAWYPLVWFFSLFGNYDLYSYNTEFIFHIFLAGLGMQYLAKVLGYNKSVMALLSISYVFSGFFASNSMFLTWVISAAWIPFIIAWFIKLLRDPNFRKAIQVSLLVFMLISGGYPAFTIVLAYILLSMAIYSFIKTIRYNKNKAILILRYLLITLVISSLLTAVVLISTALVLPHMPRGESLSINEACIPPFLPRHLISFFLPYSFVELSYDQNVLFDGSNIYMGIIIFIFFITALFSFNTMKKEMKYILLFSVIFLLLSFGIISPLYRLAFHHLPGFNYFRFPTMFRYFTILGFLIISGSSIQRFLSSNEIQRRKILLSIVSILFIVLAFFVISLFKTQIFQSSKWNSFYDFVINFGFWDRVFFQSIFQIFILLTILLSVIYIKKKRKIIIAILFISMVDLIISFNVYMPYTISSYKVNMKESNEILHKNIHDFSLEYNNNIYENATHPDSLYLFSHYLFIYKKVISDKGNTFKLSNFNKLKNNNKSFYNKVIQNPVFYFPDTVYMENSLEQRKKQGIKSGDLFVAKADYDNNYLGNGKILNVDFQYNKIIIQVKNHNPSYFIFLQNYFPGWKAKVNDYPQKIILANTSFMAIKLPSGLNKLQFYFEPKPVIIGLYISIISLIIAILYLIFFHKKNKK